MKNAFRFMIPIIAIFAITPISHPAWKISHWRRDLRSVRTGQ